MLTKVSVLFVKGHLSMQKIKMLYWIKAFALGDNYLEIDVFCFSAFGR